MGNDGSTPTKSKFERRESTERTDGSTSKDEGPRRRKKNKTMKSQKVASSPTNPFLIFFLRMRSKKPNQPVTVIARTAGKLWGKMTPDERQKYVNMANAAKKKRGKKKRKRTPKDTDEIE